MSNAPHIKRLYYIDLNLLQFSAVVSRPEHAIVGVFCIVCVQTLTSESEYNNNKTNINHTAEMDK